MKYCHFGDNVTNFVGFLDEDLPELSSDFRPGQQEDAHEFLRCLLDNLHKCTLDPKSKGKPSSFDEESIVKQVFGGRLKSQVCTVIAYLFLFAVVFQLMLFFLHS